jgi:hypothetical protein
MNKKLEKIKDKLKMFENMSLSDIDINDVDELTNIKINKKKSSNERILDFLNEVKNPYVFKMNGKLVRISFSNTDRTADDCLTRVLEKLYK